MSRVTYYKEAVLENADPSRTLLQLSMGSGIPHCHACGGNARCSTCRIAVLDGHENLSPRNAAEAELARQKGFGENIRLACQTRVLGPVTIRRLVMDSEDMEVAVAGSERSVGKERKLAVLFSDIRNFTPFTEKFLPYDVVHILNRYFRKMGQEILRHDGYIDKYMGDGIMALFGLEKDDPSQACEDAIFAALGMLEALTEFNSYLLKQFETTLRIGIGIDFGTVIVGEMGHPRKMQFSAIGDVVNTASRIESATKEHGAALLVSDTVREQVLDFAQVKRSVDAGLKGKSGVFRLHEIGGVDAAQCLRRRMRDETADLRKELARQMVRTEAPLMLRLAFHDAGTYDPATKRGGADGSVRFAAEYETEDNRPLKPALASLTKIKASFPGVSWADLIALAGAVAVEKCGGPIIPIALGRKDAIVSEAARSLPREHMDGAALMQWFGVIGFTPRQVVALSGAHTLGHSQNKPFTNDLFSFTNVYYKRLLDEPNRSDLSFLPSDLALVQVPELRVHVEEFARDQDAFFREFSAAYRKLTALGTSLA